MTTIEHDVQASFKEVMAGVATPVSIVTTISDKPYGATVSAFASLSMSPPMVLVSLDRGSDTLQQIRETQRFGLNILGSDQSETALSFAKKGGLEKFTGTGWSVDHEVPRIHGAPGWIACSVADLVDGGDHVIVLGHVVAAELNHARPLIYHGRVFGTYILNDCFGW
ncbi:flavin reductase family protein [Nocardioides sp. NPDC127514]|uniref:flavin reductase family protein n=1 Tax=unclassified Nocardioides TaxID=2615069 RepID=UPI0033184E7B